MQQISTTPSIDGPGASESSPPGQSVSDQAQAKASEVAGQAQEKAQQAAGQAKDKLREQIDPRSQQAARTGQPAGGRLAGRIRFAARAG